MGCVFLEDERHHRKNKNNDLEDVMDFEKRYRERCVRGIRNANCICSIIEELEGEEVFIVTKSGDEIDGEIKKVDPKTGCVVIVVESMLPTGVKRSKSDTVKTIIGCNDIESITIVKERRKNNSY